MPRDFFSYAVAHNIHDADYDLPAYSRTIETADDGIVPHHSCHSDTDLPSVGTWLTTPSTFEENSWPQMRNMGPGTELWDGGEMLDLNPA